MLHLIGSILFVCTVLAFPAAEHIQTDFLVARRPPARPLPPSQDAFYTAPANLSAYAPGDVIRTRPPPLGIRFFGAAPANLARAHQLLYRTTSPAGEPLAATTTVMIPHDADYSKLLSYQVEADTADVYCQPSFALQQPRADPDNIAGQYGALWYIAALKRGWVVASPDHEGPNGAFTVGILGGRATLDGVRAVRRAGSLTGVREDATVVLWGYSGGAMATEFAVEQQEAYAPELRIAAAAMGGLPVNLRHIFEFVNRGLASGIAVSGSVGLARAYPQVQALFDERLVPDKKADFEKVGHQCLLPTVSEYAFQNVYDYFQGGKTVLENEAVRSALAENSMGNGAVPKLPMLFYQATQDEIVPFKDTEGLYDKYCAAGANIHFVKELLAGHVLMAVTGAPAAFDWISDRMNGKPVPSGCSSEVKISSLLDLRALGTLGEFVVGDLTTLLGGRVGPLAKAKNEKSSKM